MSVLSEETRGGALMVGSTAVAILAGVGTGVLLARALGPEGRGAMAAIITAPHIFAWLFAIGSVQTISYFHARAPEDGAKLLSTWLALTVPLGLLAVVGGELLLPVLFGAQSEHTLHVARWFMLIAFPLLLNEALVGFILGAQRFVLYAVVRAGAPAAIALGYVALWAAGALTVASAVIAFAVVQTVAVVVLLVASVRAHGVVRPDGALARQTLWYGLRGHGSNISTYLNARLDLLILPAFLSASTIGLYSVATNVSWIVFLVPGSLSLVALPLAARDQATAAQSISRSFRMTLALAVTAATLLAVVAPVAVRVVYGAEFSGAVGPLRILLLGSVLYAGAQVIISGLHAANRPFTATLAQGAGLLVTVVGLLLFLRSGGINAAAIVSSAAYAVVFAVALTAYHQHVRSTAVAKPQPPDRIPILQAHKEERARADTHP